jgi:serine/threonine protein kinase/cytochrome c-type biogenesis protein CcmH/NrfG
MLAANIQRPDWLSLGADALNLRHFEEALQHFAKGFTSSEHLVQAQVGIGMGLEGLGKIEAARFAYQHALKISPESADAAAHLAALPPAPSITCEWIVGQQLTSDISCDWQYKVKDVKRGGFGIVYIVSDREGDSLVLKTMQGQFDWHEEDRCRFEREIVTWLRLGNHPRVVRAITLDRVEGRPVLVMEYLPGGSVAEQITNCPVNLETALRHGLDICTGMAYAHKRLGVVHRDLKPANCLLTKAERLKVTDFGLAKMLSELKARELGLPDLMSHYPAFTSTPMGTTSYMSPEQFERGAELDTRADVYSFGVMLFEMLTNELPRDGRAAQELVKQSDAGQALPNNLRSIILRCVDLERDQRPTDFQQLQNELAEEYRQCVGKEPPSPEAVHAPNVGEFNLLGMTFSQLGHMDDAIRFFDDGLDISPLDRYLLINKGTTLRESARFQEALKCYEMALEVAPDSAALWGNMARLFVEMCNPSAALGALDRGLELAPDDSVLIGNKAVVLFQLGKSSEALTLSAAVLAAHPRNGRLLTARGDMLFKLGRHQEALDCFERALVVDPLNYEAWGGKATISEKTANYRDALVYVNRALELQPNQPDLRELKSRIVAQQ